MGDAGIMCMYCRYLQQVTLVGCVLSVEWNSMGMRGNVKEGLKLTLMSSFDVEQGGVNSRPGSCGVLEWVRTDGPGFLCAAPLELSGPGICGVGQRSGERAEVRRCNRLETSERVGSERRS